MGNTALARLSSIGSQESSTVREHFCKSALKLGQQIVLWQRRILQIKHCFMQCPNCNSGGSI